MSDSTPIRRDARPAAIRPDEQGYIMLAAIFFLAILVLSLAVAAPRIARSIQRDRELETFHRGMQYRRAVQLYFRKFHAYPPNVDALVQSNNVRFLRKKYIDPMTRKVDWKPVMYGQNKTPTAMGFFGQALSGNATTIAGVGPGGGNGLGGNSGLAGNSIFGGPTPSTGTDSGNGTISGNGVTSGSTGATGSTTSGTSSSASNGPGSAGGNGGTSGSSSSTGTVSSGTGSSGSTGSGTGSGQTGQTFGGMGIIGFSPASPKQSILVYKKKNHYNEWEFTYDPLSDSPATSGGNTGTVGQPASSTSSPVGSPSSGSSSTGTSPGPSSNGTSSNPAPPSSTPTPQQ